ncbi:MAG: hypothetical protein C4533_05880 [Candidatus Omnitrophota bacterium]|jgi:1,4-alpha-glucan branching enzyme|nr:MAG: hypothetical protein C4533_05880 [Candidatus Omnitrophota bacterium]
MPRVAKQKTAQFRIFAPSANRVVVAGSFNNWNTSSLSAKKDSKGNWVAKVNLKPGKYEYKFLVDNNWVNDPKCTSSISNSFGSTNSVLEIK